MIVMRMSGRLGNQMFQYATGRALSLRHGYELALDGRDTPASPWGRFALDALTIVDNRADQDKLPYVGRSWRQRYKAGPASLLGLHPSYRERGLRFNRKVLSLRDGTILKGYFQSEKYFVDKAETIAGELRPRMEAEGANAEMLSQIAGGVSVSVHVRRGDYVSIAKTQRVHGSCDAAYYREAAAFVASKYETPPAFYVFSDEPEWVRENMQIGFPFKAIDINDDHAAHEDLRLMAACTHNIVANSSFSWWGAWLNASPDKIVVAPKQWFADPKLDYSTLVPESWVRL